MQLLIATAVELQDNPKPACFAELVLRFMADIVREHHISAWIYPSINRFKEGC